MSVTGLVLLGKENEICNDGKFSYRFKSDMYNFKRITINSINVIVGSKTFKESYFPLENRFHFVITREKVHDKKLDQNVTFSNAENMINIIKHNKMSNFCVIGGMTIYDLFKDVIDTWYITKVHDRLYKPIVTKDDKIFDMNKFVPEDKFIMTSTKLYVEPNLFNKEDYCIFRISKYEKGQIK